MSAIESRNYIATDSDIQKVAGDIIDGVQKIDSGRGTFLKMAVATTQSDLGSEPRLRNAKPKRLNDDEVVLHMKTFQAVAERFYDAVLAVARATVPEPDTMIVRQRTAFARSALSTVRGYIRAGNDIRTLAAARCTKASLATPRTRRTMTVQAMRRRAERTATDLIALAENLNAANHEIAQTVVGPIIAQLINASGISTDSIKDQSRAIAESVPFHTKTDVFVPINLEAFRQFRKAA